MTENQKDQLREKLQSERAEIVGEIGDLRNRDVSNKTGDGADAGERAELEAERTIEHELSKSDANLLAKIDLALQRLEAGTYEECLHCAGPIPIERLMAKPSVSLCVACQSKKEAGEFVEH